MKIIENEQIIKIDVDDTLIVWGNKCNKKFKSIKMIDPYSKKTIRFKAHAGHIKVLKDRKARGAYIVVWSSGGYRWAEAIVKALKLTRYVDEVSSKPIMYIDDLTATDILGERLYLDKFSDYGI